MSSVSAEDLQGWGFLHNAPKRFNPGSRRQSGVGFDPDFSQFPNDFGYTDRLWLFTELVAPYRLTTVAMRQRSLFH